MTRSEYDALYPGGCPFIAGQPLTLLSKEDYNKKVKACERDLLYGGYNDDCCYGSRGWKFIRVEEVRCSKSGHSFTQIRVKPPGGSEYIMADIEFQEFYKPVKIMFKKGEYIVVTEGGDNNGSRSHYPNNHVYKQRKDDTYLLTELDAAGNTDNGWGKYHANRSKLESGNNWRYATAKEVDHYIKVGKPYNIADLVMQPAVENQYLIY